MSSESIPTLTDGGRHQPPVDDGIRFLGTLFAEDDLILFRPIETWIEEGKKKSHVIHDSVSYRTANVQLLPDILRQLIEVGTGQRANIFFGVCPRFGGEGKFDLACQIRVVRTLWCDIDNVSANEVQERLASTSLPRPSIIVNSGHGIHLYWLLDSAYLIDDACDPLPVETEKSEGPGRPKKAQKYIVTQGDKVFLEQRPHVSRLSPKAKHIENVVAGIAKALGGDHTQDLARLLRIPGTFNRKDQRNGRAPVPAFLIECEPSRRYPLSTFELLKSASQATERAIQIEAMPLPKVRKISSSKADKLGEIIAASSIASMGSRSEADFAVCCYAIRNGIEKEQVWSQVEGVGKFSEHGRRYFDLTWENAEYDVRASTLEKLEKTREAPKVLQIPNAKNGNDESDGLEAREDPEDRGGSRDTILVDPQTMPVGDTLHRVTNQLLAAGNCFSRAEQLVVINDDQIVPILSSQELAGLLNQRVEFYFFDDKGSGAYKPLPSAYANTWLNHLVERSRLPKIKLFTRNPVYTDDWRLVEPGFDPESGIYYAARR